MQSAMEVKAKITICSSAKYYGSENKNNNMLKCKVLWKWKQKYQYVKVQSALEVKAETF